MNWARTISRAGKLLGERAARARVLHVQIGASFPQLRVKLFIERRAQISDAFGAARAALGANHSLDHLDVMRAPEREILVVLDQRLDQLKLLEARLKVRQDFE